MLNASMTVGMPLYRSPRSNRVTDRMKRAGTEAAGKTGSTRPQVSASAFGNRIKRLGISAGAVRVRVVRALARLRDLLTDLFAEGES